jgi:hypothetical protein
METKNTSIANILPLVFKAVGLAMGVASVVLSAMGVADMDTLVTLLSIGLVALGIASLSQE